MAQANPAAFAVMLRASLGRQLGRLQAYPDDERTGAADVVRLGLLSYARLAGPVAARALLEEAGGWPPDCGAAPELPEVH